MAKQKRATHRGGAQGWLQFRLGVRPRRQKLESVGRHHAVGGEVVRRQAKVRGVGVREVESRRADVDVHPLVADVAAGMGCVSERPVRNVTERDVRRQWARVFRHQFPSGGVDGEDTSRVPGCRSHARGDRTSIGEEGECAVPVLHVQPAQRHGVGPRRESS